MNDGYLSMLLRLVEKSTMSSCKLRAAMWLTAFLAVPTVWAHHSFAAYDQTTLMRSGTLKRFDANATPATIFITYTNDKGEPGQMTVIRLAP